jgi:hypothetical protein
MKSTICLRCNKEFISPKPTPRLYCSKECKKPINAKILLHCSHCNKEFSKYPSQVKNSKEKFCSIKCGYDYREANWKFKVKRICIECENEFEIYQSEIDKGTGAGKFCSRKCQANRHEIRNCLTCHKEFKVMLSAIKRGFGNYCSKGCHNDRTNPIEYFFKNISDESHPNGCWIWMAAKDKDGYGTLWKDRKKKRAHRFSYEIHKSIIPKDLIICHTCDTPSCCNPEHLWLGTQWDNARDREKKNRGRYSKQLVP